MSIDSFVGTGKTENRKEVPTGFKEAKAILAECKLLEELDIMYFPGGEYVDFTWTDKDGNKVATGSWCREDGFKVKVGDHEFTGGQAENLTLYYKTKQHACNIF